MNEFELNKKLNTGIEEIKKISMTAEEKKRIWENVLNTPVSEPTPSPYPFYTFISNIQITKLVHYVVLPCLVLFLGTGAVFASGDSLPGNILYPLKVRVVEPVRSVLILSPQVRAEYHSQLATKRLNEAEVLMEQGNLDIETETKLNALISTHATDMTDALSKVSDTDGGEDVSEDIVTDFQANMNAHAKVLDLIQEQEGNLEDADTTKISDTARENANKARSSLNKTKENNLEKYNKRKEDIQLLIDSTTLEINNIDADTLESKRAILEDTSKTLEEAREFLKEGEAEAEEGNEENAYEKLLDGESAAKEANILLKTGTMLEEEN
jgi:hypothetical protein